MTWQDEVVVRVGRIGSRIRGESRPNVVALGTLSGDFNGPSVSPERKLQVARAPRFLARAQRRGSWANKCPLQKRDKRKRKKKIKAITVNTEIMNKITSPQLPTYICSICKAHSLSLPTSAAAPVDQAVSDAPPCRSPRSIHIRKPVPAASRILGKYDPGESFLQIIPSH